MADDMGFEEFRGKLIGKILDQEIEYTNIMPPKPPKSQFDHKTDPIALGDDLVDSMLVEFRNLFQQFMCRSPLNESRATGPGFVVLPLHCDSNHEIDGSQDRRPIIEEFIKNTFACRNNWENYSFEKINTKKTRSYIGFTCNWEKQECNIYKSTRDLRKVRRALDRLRHIAIVLEEWTMDQMKGMEHISFVWDQEGDVIDREHYLFLPAIYIVWKKTAPPPSPADFLAQYMESMVIEEIDEDKKPDSHVDIDGISKAMECVTIGGDSQRRSDTDTDSYVEGLPMVESDEDDF